MNFQKPESCLMLIWSKTKYFEDVFAAKMYQFSLKSGIVVPYFFGCILNKQVTKICSRPQHFIFFVFFSYSACQALKVGFTRWLAFLMILEGFMPRNRQTRHVVEQKICLYSPSNKGSASRKCNNAFKVWKYAALCYR